MPPGKEIPNEAVFMDQPWPEGAQLQKSEIVFKIRHQKGLLAELWYWFDSQGEGSATEALGPSVSPRKYHEKLVAWVGEGAGSDVAAGPTVSQHPVYGYSFQATPAKNAAGRDVMRYQTKVTLVAYATDPDATGMTTEEVEYEYEIPVQAGDGDGSWLSARRPGSIWKPVGNNRSGNTSARNPCIREVLKGSETIYILSQRDYRPWPCS